MGRFGLLGPGRLDDSRGSRYPKKPGSESSILGNSSAMKEECGEELVLVTVNGTPKRVEVGGTEVSGDRERSGSGDDWVLLSGSGDDDPE